MSQYGVPIIDHELADDGTVYLLRFPGGGKEYEFVSHASYQRLKHDMERGMANHNADLNAHYIPATPKRGYHDPL